MDENDTDRVACRALGLAVLEEALFNLKDARRRRRKVAERELMQWIENDDDTYIFNFVPLCQWLGFDADSMRKKVKGLR